MQAYEFVVTWVSEGDKMKLKSRFVFVYKNNKIFSVACIVPESDYDEYEAVCEKSIQSFRIL